MTTSPEFDFIWDKVRARYVIRRNGQHYQEIIPNRHNPAQGRTYVERCVDILNNKEQ